MIKISTLLKIWISIVSLASVTIISTGYVVNSELKKVLDDSKIELIKIKELRQQQYELGGGIFPYDSLSEKSVQILNDLSNSQLFIDFDEKDFQSTNSSERSELFNPEGEAVLVISDSLNWSMEDKQVQVAKINYLLDVLYKKKGLTDFNIKELASTVDTNTNARFIYHLTPSSSEKDCALIIFDLRNKNRFSLRKIPCSIEDDIVDKDLIIPGFTMAYFIPYTSNYSVNISDSGAFDDPPERYIDLAKKIIHFQ